MFNKKAFAGSLILVSLAGGIVASAMASNFDATTPVVKAEAAAESAPAPVSAVNQTTMKSIHVVYLAEQAGGSEISPASTLQNEGTSFKFVAKNIDGYEFQRIDILYMDGTVSYTDAVLNIDRAEMVYQIAVWYKKSEVPTTEAPTTEAPTTEAPTTEIPTTEVPTTEVLITEAPTTEAPSTTTSEPTTTEAPTTEAPTTEAPTTEAPTTEAPTTEVPTTEVPTTEVPTTEAPTTEVPTTEAPTTENQKATISFDLAGGSLNGQTGTVNLEAEVGQTITLPEAPTREGYRFLHWKGSVYQAGAQYTVTGPKTFTAVWEPVAAPTTTTTSASETPKKILPATGEASSLLSLAGLGLAGFAGFLGFKRKQD